MTQNDILETKRTRPRFIDDETETERSFHNQRQSIGLNAATKWLLEQINDPEKTLGYSFKYNMLRDAEELWTDVATKKVVYSQLCETLAALSQELGEPQTVTRNYKSKAAHAYTTGSVNQRSVSPTPTVNYAFPAKLALKQKRLQQQKLQIQRAMKRIQTKEKRATSIRKWAARSAD